MEVNTVKKIFSDSELDEKSVILKFRISAADGKNYNTSYYNLSAEIAKGQMESLFEMRWIVQDRFIESDFDRMLRISNEGNTHDN